MLASALSALALAGSALAVPMPEHFGARHAGRISPRASNSTGAPYFSYYADKGSAPPAASDLAGWNVFLLSFWLTEGPWDMVYTWTAMTDDERQQVKTEYNNAGIKLMVSAFGSTDVPTSSGLDPTTTAQDLAAFVKQYSFDGCDVDYEDFQAFDTGKSEAWLITFTKALRTALGDDYLISHAPVAPWFTDNTTTYPNGGYLKVDQEAGDQIDFYNVQFYNQGVGVYEDCDTLITKSNMAGHEHASLMEIIANGVDANKLVLGKPAAAGDANNGLMDAATLATCVQQAKSQDWNGGLMLWQYPDAPANFVSTVWGS